jgi:hypothetical protein
MTCPLCGTRKARRGCPALGTLICPVCCGTKRRAEIACPDDCGWLRSAESHPPAALQRQQAEDQGRLHALLGGLDEGAYVALTICLRDALAYRASAVPAPLDEDLQGAAAALAATFETAARGVIYEHQPDTLVAGRLVAVWRDTIDSAAADGARQVEAEAATALRRIERSVRDRRRDHADRPAAYFEFLGRVLRQERDEEKTGIRLAEQALADLSDPDGRGIL